MKELLMLNLEVMKSLLLLNNTAKAEKDFTPLERSNPVTAGRKSTLHYTDGSEKVIWVWMFSEGLGYLGAICEKQNIIINRGHFLNLNSCLAPSTKLAHLVFNLAQLFN